MSQDYGSWVLVIGAARYALLLAGWLIPWLAAPLPPRYWGKVVAAVQGIVLTVAASGLLDRLVGMIAVAAALLLLAESFGRNVIWLYRTGAGPRSRRALRLTITVLSVVLVWGVLVAPDRVFQLTPAAFVRIPVEGLALVAVAVVLPAWPRRIVAAVAGILFGLLTLVKILNMAFYEEVARAFNPVFGWVEISPAIGVVRDTIGPTPHKHRARRALARSHPARRRNHCSNYSHHHRRRPASPRHGSRTRRPHRGLGAVRRPVTATRPGIPGRLDQRRRAGRHAGARLPGSAPRPAPFREGPPRLRP